MDGGINTKILLKILILPLLLSLFFVSTTCVGAIKDEKTGIIIGDDINYPPYSFLDSKGKPSGFNIDIAKASANAIGLEVEFRLDEWNKIRTSLENNELDAISGMFYSKERDLIYSFSSKHSMANGDIFSLKGVKVSNLEDLRGKTVAVVKAEIIGEYLDEMNIGINLIEVPTVKEALTLVEDGIYEHAGVLKLPGLYTINQYNMANIESKGLNFTPLEYCMAVKDGNENLLLTLNSGLQVIKATGEYDQIYDKWLGIYDKKELLDILLEYSWVFIMIGTIIVGLTFNIIILNKMIHIKTKELKDANKNLIKNQEELTSVNEEMEASMEEIMKIEEELRVQYNQLIASETKLKESEERNKAIVNALPDIIFTLNKDGVFLDCQISNSEELLLPKEKFCGKLLWDVLPKEIADIGFQKLILSIKTKQVQCFEYELELSGLKQVFEMRMVHCRDNEVIGITRNISQQKMYHERIEYLSYHDQLTGLYNRRFFEEELNRLDSSRKFPLCIILADVNGLKLVNDSFGHKIGDQLLVRFASVLKSTCNKGEIVSRIGGDEFVIIIPEIVTNQAEVLIKEIMEKCEKEKIESIQLSISLGYDTKYEIDTEIQEVFNRAEDYMYKRKLFESPSMRGKTVTAIINTLYEKNKREEEHSRRVSDLCKQCATVLGLSQHDVEEIKTAGLLHDIGKIAIKEDVLNKPTKLTEDEYEEIKRHSEVGYRILSSVNDLAELAEYVLLHHERWDGKGYPKGLKGQEIPIQARLISVIDTYDAITSDRSYRMARTEEEAVEELLKNAGTQFDPTIVEVFVRDVIGYKKAI